MSSGELSGVPHNEQHVQNDGAVEQWLDGPGSSSRNLSDRSNGQDGGAEGVYIKPSIFIFNMSPVLIQCVWLSDSLHSRAHIQRPAICI